MKRCGPQSKNEKIDAIDPSTAARRAFATFLDRLMREGRRPADFGPNGNRWDNLSLAASAGRKTASASTWRTGKVLPERTTFAYIKRAFYGERPTDRKLLLEREEFNRLFDKADSFRKRGNR